MRLGLQEEATWGAASCPCVESVQGSSLMPVHVRREVRLLGQNLRLFQVCVARVRVSPWPPLCVCVCVCVCELLSHGRLFATL